MNKVMLHAVQFGAGNIGRGFIAEILNKNDFKIDFVNVNQKITDALCKRGKYTIEYASEKHEKIVINNINGINIKANPDKVIEAVANADLVTTAVGPKVLPVIAELIAKGIAERRIQKNYNKLDVIACENMIGGSKFLFGEVEKYLSLEDKEYVEQYVGFPNAAVDRIVPIQHHDDPLFVTVEPFHEWVIDDSQRKAKSINLEGVEYVSDLQPYIERKLFTVNTGHATTAYTGFYYGYKTIGKAIANERVLKQLRDVLSETSNLLVTKWRFNRDELEAYIK
jgi:mannitol-1-phosphate 5-dehydrogenase